jgi:hypothetical protein
LHSASPATCHHGGIAQHAHVKLSGDISGRYVVTDQRAGGELTLVPDTSWKAILERSGGREMNPDESAEFWTEHEPHMLPPDDEP